MVNQCAGTHLSEHDLALELGAGSAPWARADILVDRYLEDPSCQRGGAEILFDTRPYLIANGEQLPFKDGIFDYVYCNHVLEHAENVGAMLEEMMRVARAGYIETPNPLLEFMHPLPEHHWYIALIGDELLIAPKTAAVPEGSLLAGYASAVYTLLGSHRLVSAYWPNFVTRLEWSGKIRYRIVDDVKEILVLACETTLSKSVAERNAGTTLLRAWASLSAERGRKRIHTMLESLGMLSRLRQWRRRTACREGRREVALEAICCCPACHGELESSTEALICRACGHRYALVRGNIPLFA